MVIDWHGHWKQAGQRPQWSRYQFEVVTTAQPGTELEITGRNADSSWFAVRIDGQDGWLASFLVTVPDDTSSLPIVQ